MTMKFYVLYDSNTGMELDWMDSIAICYDKMSDCPECSPIMLKFGNPTLVKRWYEAARSAFLNELDVDLCYVEGKYEVDEINRCIECTGYIKKLVETGYFDKVQIDGVIVK